MTSSRTVPLDSAIAALYKHSLNVFSVNATVSALLVIVACQTMPETHFQSIKRSHNQTDVANRLGDRDFILAVCTCFIRKCGRFEVIRDFRSLNHGGIPFPVDGSIAEQKWRHHSISGWRFNYSLCQNFPSILFHSKVIQEFHAFAMVKKFFQVWGQL
jgi:hypothetical protein